MAKQHFIRSGEYAGKTIEQLALMDYPALLSRRKFLYEGARKGIVRLWPEIKAMDKLYDLLNLFLKEEKCETSECNSLADHIWMPYVIAYNPHTEKNFTDYNFSLYELHCKNHRADGKFERFPLTFDSTTRFSTKTNTNRMNNILLTLLGFYQDKPIRKKTIKEAQKFFDYLRSGRQQELF